MVRSTGGSLHPSGRSSSYRSSKPVGSILWVLANEKPSSTPPLFSRELRPPAGALANGGAFTHLELILFLHSKQLIKAMVALALCAMAVEGGGRGGTFVIGRCVTSKGFVLLARTRHVLSHL